MNFSAHCISSGGMTCARGELGLGCHGNLRAALGESHGDDLFGFPENKKCNEIFSLV